MKKQSCNSKSRPKRKLRGQKKVGKVLGEYKSGKLKSGGKKVTNRKQAIAIAMSEAGMSKKRKKKK